MSSPTTYAVLSPIGSVETNTTKDRLDWLQGLRGIAAVAVVICHARFFLEGTSYAWLADNVLRAGESGVDLFFVISGFIMAYNLDGRPGGRRAALSFAARRFARIWPAYAVLTLLTVGIHAAMGMASIPPLYDVVRSILFAPVHYSGLYLDQYLPQGWTLTFEAYFYILLTICVVSGRFMWLTLALWMVLFLIAIPLLLGSISLTSPFLPFVDPAFGMKSLMIACNPIVWEFVGGVVAGLAYRSRFSFVDPVIASFLVWSSVIFTFFSVFNVQNTHGISQWGFGFVQLVFVLAIATKSIKVDLGGVLSRIGNASYTLYLVHLLVFDVCNGFVRWVGFDNILSTPEYAVAMTFASIVVALLSRATLEKRLSVLVFLGIEKLLPLAWRSSHEPLMQDRGRRPHSEETSG